MSNNTEYSNKRIALNAFFLFIRSLISIVVALYASRILLQKLGVEDYGVYYVVGGVVTMFNSLRSFFASSIQRFLNYAKGKRDAKEMNEVFCTGVEIQLVLSIAFLMLMESLGVVAVMNLNLTESQMEAAHVVFQLSVLSAITSMLIVPYDALIIANERMIAYASFSIFESVSRLVIIYMIAFGPFSNLVNYAILAFVVTTLVRFVNSIYCKYAFPHFSFHWVWNKPLVKEMGTFASWNFLGNTGFSLTHEGVNYVLNIVGGVTINAARALTYQVIDALNNLLGNINTAFKPQINASAAETGKSLFYDLLTYNAKASFSLYVMMMVPAVIYSHFVIQLWLGTIPEYVLSFIMAVSVYHLLRTIHVPIDSFYISIGELKYYQISEICFQILNIPLAYILLRSGFPFWSVFIGMAFVEVLNHISIVTIASRKYNFPIKKYGKNVYVPFVSLSLVSVVIVLAARYFGLHETENAIVIILSCILMEVIILLFIFFMVLNKAERERVTLIFISKLSINKK